MCAIFFDYRKAFDSVPHRPLLKKLTSFSIDPFLIRWVTHYLTLRYQHVVVEGAKSTAAPVLSGVPQGSVLGPLLFLIYINGINDLTLSTEACSVTFADDVCIYRPIHSQNDYKLVQEDISAVEKWSDENFLTLNPQKCKYMVISRKRAPTAPDHQAPLLLHNLVLSRVCTFKYLGVLLAEDLAWTPHVHAVCSKARQVLGLLYRRFYNYSNVDTLVQLYVSMVRPHLEYACPVWAPHTAKDIQELERVQRFAGRMATHNWNSSYSELQSIVNLPTLERRRLELKLGHLFKIVHNLCFFPNNIIRFRELTQTVSSTRSVHSLCLEQPFAHTNSFYYSFVPHATSIWNSLPQELVTAPSLQVFKSNLHNCSCF